MIFNDYQNELIVKSLSLSDESGWDRMKLTLKIWNQLVVKKWVDYKSESTCFYQQNNCQNQSRIGSGKKKASN